VSRATQLSDEREDAPNNGIGGGMIVDKALGRPVVRVGVGVAGPLCGGRPCCPTEEGNELAYLLGVSDRRWDGGEI
jgi:hypothetical protein